MPYIGTAIYTCALVGTEMFWTCMVSYDKQGTRVHPPVLMYTYMYHKLIVRDLIERAWAIPTLACWEQSLQWRASRHLWMPTSQRWTPNNFRRTTLLSALLTQGHSTIFCLYTLELRFSKFRDVPYSFSVMYSTNYTIKIYHCIHHSTR